MNHPAHWPRLPRAALLLLVGLCCAGAGLVLTLLPLTSARTGHENQLQAIKVGVQGAVRRSAALPMLQARSEQLASRLQSGADDPLSPPLQVLLGVTADQCGLVLEAFRPVTDGAEIGVAGDYGALLLFVAMLSQAPHALLFESLDLSDRRTATPPGLLMKASVRHQSLSVATHQEPAHP
jgi:Tfp pilus assembly protein PilO